MTFYEIYTLVLVLVEPIGKVENLIMTVNPRILNFVNFKIFGTYVTRMANRNSMVITLLSAKLVKQSLIVKSWQRMKSRDTDFTVIMTVISLSNCKFI